MRTNLLVRWSCYYRDCYRDYSVSGVEVAVRRKMDRLELWLGSTTDLQLVTEVGRKLKAQLGTGKSRMKFSIHHEEKEGVKGPCLMI